MMQIGTRVQIAAKLDVVPSWPGRKPGARGLVSAYEDHSAGPGTVYKVYHDGPTASATTARYRESELTPIRERATEAAAPSPEQVRLDELEARVNKLVGEAEQTRDVVARELAGLQNQLEHHGDRLRALEQQPPRHPEPVHDDVTLDARPSELSAFRELRRVAEEWWRQIHWEGDPDPELSGLEREIGDALLTLDELDDDGSPDEIPEEPAPPPSDAYGEIEQLRKELDQARADVDLLRSQRDDAISRNARALETLRGVFDLRPDCTLITDAADDACEYPRELMRALGYDGVDGPLPAQCLRDVRAQREQLERLRGRLADITGNNDESPLFAELLGQLEPRMAIMSELELFSPEALNDTAEGLEHLGGEESAYIGALLYKVAALQGAPAAEPEPDSSDSICFCGSGPCTCDAGSTSRGQR